MLSIRKRYRVDRKSVCWIKFIFEAYDGIAQVSTTDPHAAEIEMRIPPGCEKEVDDLIANLKNNMIIEPVNVN
jgi:hypothetical protein